MLLNITGHGADIGYKGPQLSRVVPNSSSARTLSDVLRKQICKEVALKHSLGPFLD